MSDNPTLPGTHLGAVRLTDWGVIRASGADARSFLHGQLTQDVLHLQPGQARLAGYCSAKGRLLASFVVWVDDGGDLLLACSADLLPAVHKRLSMFVLRAKCKLTDATAELPLWGVAGHPDQAPALAVWATGAWSGATLVRLPDAPQEGGSTERYLWTGTASPPLPALDVDTWRWLEVLSGVPRIAAPTVEQFVPQMVNLELVGGVNFQKGCYPGQEVVARSQYRGTLKRRAYVIHADAPLVAGQEIFSRADPGQPAGMVVLAGRNSALAELKIAAAEAGDLQAGPEGASLRLGPLPYALPTDHA